MCIPPEAYILMGAIALTAVGPFVLKPLRHEVIAPRFWVMAVYLIGFVLRPWLILIDEDYGHPYIRFDQDFPALVVDGLAVALVGLVLFWIGYYSRIGRRAAALLPGLEHEISPRRFRQAVFGCLVVGLLAYALFLRTVGGLPQLLAILYMRAAVFEADEVLGPTKEISKLVGIASVMGMYYHVALKRAWWAWPLLLFASVVTASLGSRGAVIQLWLATYFMYAFVRPRYRSWKALGALVLVLIVFASAALAFRRGTRDGTETALESVRALPEKFTKNLTDSVPMFDHMLGAFEATDREFPRLEGASYVQLVPVMVPRSVWPIETETAGVTLRKAMEPFGTGGRPSSLMGEGYMNFGLVGALVPMLFLGIWCRLVHSFMVRTNGRSRIAALLFAYAILGTPRILTGVLPLAIRELLFRLGAVGVAFGWSARTSARPVPGASESPANEVEGHAPA